MTDRRIRDAKRLLEPLADAHGGKVRIELTNGGHMRAVFIIGAHEIPIIASFSPKSEWRPHRQTEAIARRKLREIVGVRP